MDKILINQPVNLTRNFICCLASTLKSLFKKCSCWKASLEKRYEFYNHVSLCDDMRDNLKLSDINLICEEEWQFKAHRILAANSNTLCQYPMQLCQYWIFAVYKFPLSKTLQHIGKNIFVRFYDWNICLI